MSDFVQRTIDLARQNVAEGGRPFATVIVKDAEILAESANKVAQANDPTAHAEMLAIREACVKLGTEHLVDCAIYVLAQPCPMCLGSPLLLLAQRGHLPDHRYQPHEAAVGVYRFWNERNGGQRQSTVVPPA